MEKVAKWLVIIALYSFLGLRSSAQVEAHHNHCPVERAAIKTSLKGVNLTPVRITIAQLAKIQAPNELLLKKMETERFPEESQTYQVNALLIGYKLESDRDFHLVIADPNNPKVTMIAEVVSPLCTHDQQLFKLSSQLRPAFAKRFRPPTPQYSKLVHPVAITITGVFMFDSIHGQTGVAVNGAELHPVIDLK